MKALVLALPTLSEFVLRTCQAARRRVLEMVERSSHGTCRLDSEAVEMLPIALPPLSEQKRIIAKLNHLITLCDDLEALQSTTRAVGTRLTRSTLDALATAAGPDEISAAWERVAENFDLLFPHSSTVSALRDLILELAFRGTLVAEVAGDRPASTRYQKVQSDWAGRKRRETLPEVRDEEQPPSPDRWMWVRLGNLGEIVGGVTKGRDLRGRKVQSYPYLRVANVQRGALDLTTMKEIEIAEDELEKYRLLPGDLLFTEGGDWDKVGRAAVWRAEIKVCIHQNHVFRARLLGDLDPTWVSLFANSPVGRRYFEGAAKQTTNLASINMTQLRNCPVPIPPLEEQRRIIVTVERLMKICDNLEDKLHRVEDRASKFVDAVVQAF
jgi:type I restriction enzyme S subunit